MVVELFGGSIPSVLPTKQTNLQLNDTYRSNIYPKYNEDDIWA